MHSNGIQVWDAANQTGTYKGLTVVPNGAVLLPGQIHVSDLGSGFPSVSSSIGIRDVSGLHNNLFGTQADWGSVDVPFRRDIAANFDNYLTTAGANYGTTVDEFGVVTQSSVIDLMPRIISRTITTAGVNLLRDGPGNTGHFVVWDPAKYGTNGSDGTDPAYGALINASGVDIDHARRGREDRRAGDD